MDRNEFAQMWQATWDGENWYASWTKALAVITPQRANWKPSPERHSIWQILNHVIFWRNYTVAQTEGRPTPDKAQVNELQFAAPSDTSDQAWKHTTAELEASHRAVGKILNDPAKPIDRVKHHLCHDAYHMGQIMQLLAMQGVAPVL
jgi:hypothetical protein